MNNSFKKLMRAQIQEYLDKCSDLATKPVPKKGWLRTIRNALGMTSSQLARRLGSSQSNIIQVEKSEAEETISLRTLAQVAGAMKCKVVYCIVPIKSIDQLLEDRARFLAQARLRLINHSMALEQQALTPKQLKQQEEALVKELLQGAPKDLWEEL